MGFGASGFALALCLCLPLAVSAQMFRPDKTDTAKRCAICHFEWVYPFFIEHRDGELIAQPKQKQVAAAEMCFSCHDGSVADSRKTLLHDPGHGTGVKPSSAVTIPAEFPLDQGGHLQCATCHTPHAVASGDSTGVGFFLRSTNTNSSFCKLCHGEAGGKKEAGNHPVDVSLPGIPSVLKEAGGRFGTDPPDRIICETCHIPHGGTRDKFLVLSIEDPATRSVLCEACHTRNPGRAGETALNRFSHPLDLPPGNKGKMPSAWPGGEAVFLGRKGELVCRTCHKPHNAPSQQYLLVRQGEKGAMCRDCHPGQSAVIGSSHDLRKSAPDALNILKRPAREIGPCDSCHSVHSGSAAFMWAQAMPDATRKPSHFCSCCHADGNCAASVAPKDFSHPMDVGVADTGASLRLPLFDGEGREKRAGTISCGTCHDVHNPRSPSAGGNDFLRSLPGEGTTGLCTHCHQQQALVAGSKHDLAITKPAFTNLLNQAPADGGLCSPCHIVHGAASKRYIWAGLSGLSPLQNPESEGAPGNIIAAICAGCHSSGGKAPGQAAPIFEAHPAGLALPHGIQSAAGSSYFLYNPDGERTPAGDITCSTCHNPHQWDSQDKGRNPGTDMKGDASNSFLREGIHNLFCASCHGEESLFKFLFYHRPVRTRQDTPFTQLKRRK